MQRCAATKRSMTRSAEAVAKAEKRTYRLKGGDPRDDGISSATGGDRTAGEFRAKPRARAAVGLGVAHGGSGVPCTEGGVEHERVRDNVGDGLIERNGSGGSNEAENNQIAFEHEIENRKVTAACGTLRFLSAVNRPASYTHVMTSDPVQLARLPPLLRGALAILTTTTQRMASSTHET